VAGDVDSWRFPAQAPQVESKVDALIHLAIALCRITRRRIDWQYPMLFGWLSEAQTSANRTADENDEGSEGFCPKLSRRRAGIDHRGLLIDAVSASKIAVLPSPANFSVISV
jgi:hypothetical protein